MLAFSSDDTRRLRRVERNILRDQFCDADVTEYRRETQTCIRSRHQAHHGRDIISTVPACLTGRFISRTINRLEMARRSKSRRRRRLSATTRRPRPRRRVGRPVLSSQLHAVWPAGHARMAPRSAPCRRQRSAQRQVSTDTRDVCMCLGWLGSHLERVSHQQQTTLQAAGPGRAGPGSCGLQVGLAGLFIDAGKRMRRLPAGRTWGVCSDETMMMIMMMTRWHTHTHAHTRDGCHSHAHAARRPVSATPSITATHHSAQLSSHAVIMSRAAFIYCQRRTKNDSAAPPQTLP